MYIIGSLRGLLVDPQFCANVYWSSVRFKEYPA